MSKSEPAAPMGASSIESAAIRVGQSTCRFLGSLGRYPNHTPIHHRKDDLLVIR